MHSPMQFCLRLSRSFWQVCSRAHSKSREDVAAAVQNAYFLIMLWAQPFWLLYIRKALQMLRPHSLCSWSGSQVHIAMLAAVWSQALSHSRDNVAAAPFNSYIYFKRSRLGSQQYNSAGFSIRRRRDMCSVQLDFTVEMVREFTGILT